MSDATQQPSKDVSRRLKEIYDALWINCEPMQLWHAERLWAIITEMNSAHEPPAAQPKPRDLQSLCDRLAEIFNTDDTPDELSTEAREAIEELWEERDALKDEVQNGKLAYASLQALYNERASQPPETELRRILRNAWEHGQFECAECVADMNKLFGATSTKEVPPAEPPVKKGGPDFAARFRK